MLHAFHISAFHIFITCPFNNQKLLPELWCFNNSFWISRKFSRQPRAISRRRSKAALLASWSENKSFLQVKVKQPHVNVRMKLSESPSCLIYYILHCTLDLHSGKSLSSVQSSGRANRQDWNTSRRNSCKQTRYLKYYHYYYKKKRKTHATST